MIGQTLSHYRILSPLGKGAMGEVFLAEDVRLGRRVAVKLLPAEVCCDPAAVERFEREARIISSLNHPHICTLHDIGVDQGRNFMVMELLEGETLGARIARGPLPVDEVLAFGADVAGALDAAHHRGVIHRDIKPANLYVTAASGIKVLDFGVAKLSDAGVAIDSTRGGTDQRTIVGTAVGTVAYMSPEQARGEAIDGRSDLFSLGIVLYEMATGRTPFAGATAAVVFEGILTKAPAAPSTLRAGLPDGFDALVMRALEKHPVRRHQSAGDLRGELKRLQRETEQVDAASASRPESTAPRSQRPSRWWWLAAPVATGAVVAGVVGWQSANAPALQSKDLVVLAALTNRTGDTMFDDTLSEALAVQLRQSPFLNLVPDQRVQATLRMMQRPADTAVDAEVGRDICQRVGAKALLTSSIAGLGSSYVITLRALDCVTGDVLAERQSQVGRKEDVLRELGQATTAFRETLGESLASITRYDAPVEAATTPSLEALKAYSQALAARRTEGDRAALPLFSRAVELDPEFALAHARLGTVLDNLNDAGRSRLHTTRAYELRDKVSELERLYIEARYFTTVERSPAKAIQAYRVSVATYPSDYVAPTNLALLLREQGEIEEAITLLRQAVALAPEEPNSKANLASALLGARRFDEARAVARDLVAMRDDGLARSQLMTLAVLAGDRALEDEQLRWAASHDDRRDTTGLLFGVALHRGQLREAERLRDEIARLFAAPGLSSVASQVGVGTAISLALAGATDRARASLALLPGDGSADETADDRLATWWVLRDGAAARRALPVALAHLSDDATGQREADVLRVLAQSAQGDDAGALTTLGPVVRQVRDHERVLLHGALSLRLGRWDDAIADFEWLRDFGRAELSPNAAVNRYELARAYEGAGRRDDARSAYANFLEFWKTADADLPIVIEAKKSFARLSS